MQMVAAAARPHSSLRLVLRKIGNWLAAFTLTVMSIVVPVVTYNALSKRKLDIAAFDSAGVMVLGTVILGADAMLFYTALANLGWGGTSFSFSALLATASYVAILVFQAYVTVSMRLAMKG